MYKVRREKYRPEVKKTPYFYIAPTRNFLFAPRPFRSWNTRHDIYVSLLLNKQEFVLIRHFSFFEDYRKTGDADQPWTFLSRYTVRRSIAKLFERIIKQREESCAVTKTHRLVRRTSCCAGDADAPKSRITLQYYANVHLYACCDVSC